MPKGNPGYGSMKSTTKKKYMVKKAKGYGSKKKGK